MTDNTQQDIKLPLENITQLEITIDALELGRTMSGSGTMSDMYTSFSRAASAQKNVEKVTNFLGNLLNKQLLVIKDATQDRLSLDPIFSIQLKDKEGLSLKAIAQSCGLIKERGCFKEILNDPKIAEKLAKLKASSIHFPERNITWENGIRDDIFTRNANDVGAIMKARRKSHLSSFQP